MPAVADEQSRILLIVFSGSAWESLYILLLGDLGSEWTGRSGFNRNAVWETTLMST